MKKIVYLIWIIAFCVTALFGETNSVAVSNTTNQISDKPFLDDFYRAETQTNAAGGEIGGENPFWTVVKIILYTAIFAVAAYFIIRFVIKKSSVPFSEDDKIVEVILTKSIGLGAYVEIIKVGTAYYLLAISSEGVRLLDKLDDKEVIDYIELNKDNLKPKTSKFFDILTFFPQSAKLSKLDFLNKQKDKLKKM